MKSSLTRTRWAAIGAAVAVTLGGGVVMVANAAAPAATNFRPLTTPCRLLDTRPTNLTANVRAAGIRTGAIKDSAETGLSKDNDIVVIFDKDAYIAESSFNVSAFNANYTYKVDQVSARPIMGECNYLFGGSNELVGEVAKALLLNVTVVGPVSGNVQSLIPKNGYITVYPYVTLLEDETNRPGYSNVNPVVGLSSVSNNVTVRLGTTLSGGAGNETPTIPNVRCSSGDYGASSCNSLDAFRIYNASGNVNVIVDVLGYYTVVS